MVKSRPSRDKSQRFDPLKAQQAELLKDDLETSLRHSEAPVRELACIAVANLSSLPSSSPLIKLIIERITDAVPSVQIAAFHAAIALSHSHSSILIGLGIVQLILPIITTYLSKEELFSSKQEEIICNALVANCVYLLESLAEENEELLEEISKSPVMDQCIFAVLQRNKAVAVPALELLSICAEGNVSLSERLVRGHAQQFLGLMPGLDSETRMMVVGLMTIALVETGNFLGVLQYALPAVAEILAVDIHGEFVTNIAPKLSQDGFKAQETFWIHEARAQQTALETLANLLVSEGDEEPKIMQHLSVESIKYVIKAALGVSSEIIVASLGYPELIDAMLDLQYAGFSCIQNLILNTSAVANNIPEVIPLLFEQLERSLEFSEEENELQQGFTELSEILSKNLMGICKKYPTAVSAFIESARAQWISKVLTLIDIENSEIKSNLLGVLSVFGKDCGEMASGVVAVVMKACACEDIEVNTEALNVLFDVFCDERFDEVLRAAGMMGLMRNGVEGFAAKVRQCADDEVREHAQEALENLIEFIKYKAVNMPN